LKNDGNQVYSYVVEYAVPAPSALMLLLGPGMMRRRRV
jgi:hypothetical protein